MDEELREELGKKPLLEMLEVIGGIPVLIGDQYDQDRQGQLSYYGKSFTCILSLYLSHITRH